MPGITRSPSPTASRTDRRSEPITRLLDGHVRTLAVLGDDTRHTENTGPATGQFRDRLTARLAEVTDQLTYWEGIREQQITTGAVAGHSQATIHPGDAVRIRGRW